MAILILKLRDVPEDELLEVQQLLDEHEIDYYETSAGNWGVSLPALWVREDAQAERAKALLKDYAAQRFGRVKGEYEARKDAGEAQGIIDIARHNPAQFVLYLLVIAAVLFISALPVILLMGIK